MHYTHKGNKITNKYTKRIQIYAEISIVTNRIHHGETRLDQAIQELSQGWDLDNVKVTVSMVSRLGPVRRVYKNNRKDHWSVNKWIEAQKSTKLSEQSSSPSTTK